MKYRYLFVGDRFWGSEPDAGEILANLLLVKYPELPLHFSIHSNARNTLENLFQNCPRDIIGRQAGTTVMLAGWENLQGTASAEQIAQAYQNLVHEIQHNCQTRLVICTIPTLQFAPESVVGQKTKELNSVINGLELSPLRLRVDLESAFLDYQNRQLVRGDLIRNLFTDTGTLGLLGQILCARTLARALAVQ
jgi:hypothetical protein